MALTGVSETTKKKQGELINPTAAVTEAQQKAVNYAANNDPTNSKYGMVAEDLLDQYLNRGEFKYDVNGDALYAQYKDQYTKNAQKAMKDTVAQSAAYTGGYSNSWGQTAGQQAYQEYMTELDNKIPELRQQAYNEYLAEGEAVLNKYGVAQGHYQDLLDRYYTERAYLDGKAETEYAKYLDERSYWDGRASSENSDYWTSKNFDEGVRQYNEQFEYQKKQDAYSNALTERNIAAQEAAAYNLNNLDLEKARAEFTEGGYPELYDYIEEYYADYPEDALADIIEYAESGYEAATENINQRLTDDDENITKRTWNVNGRTVVLDDGVNPYTGSKHRAIMNGVAAAENGYQPVASELSLTPQNFKTEDGAKIYYCKNGNNEYGYSADTYYIWSGLHGDYIDEDTVLRQYGYNLREIVEGGK